MKVFKLAFALATALLVSGANLLTAPNLTSPEWMRTGAVTVCSEQCPNYSNSLVVQSYPSGTHNVEIQQATNIPLTESFGVELTASGTNPLVFFVAVAIGNQSIPVVLTNLNSNAFTTFRAELNSVSSGWDMVSITITADPGNQPEFLALTSLQLSYEPNSSDHTPMYIGLGILVLVMSLLTVAFFLIRRHQSRSIPSV